MLKRLKEKKVARRERQLTRRGYVHHRGCATCTQYNGFLPRRRWNGHLDQRSLDEIYEQWLEERWPEEGLNTPA